MKASVSEMVGNISQAEETDTLKISLGGGKVATRPSSFDNVKLAALGSLPSMARETAYPASLETSDIQLGLSIPICTTCPLGYHSITKSSTGEHVTILLPCCTRIFSEPLMTKNSNFPTLIPDDRVVFLGGCLIRGIAIVSCFPIAISSVTFFDPKTL